MGQESRQKVLHVVDKREMIAKQRKKDPLGSSMRLIEIIAFDTLGIHPLSLCYDQGF